MQKDGQWYINTLEKRSSIDTIVRSSLNKIQSYQNSNGLLGYRSNQERGDVELSTYILSVLKKIDGKTYPQAIAIQSKIVSGLQGK